MTKSTKRAGFDWEVYFVYLDGDEDSLIVSGFWTPEEAIAEARTSLNAYCKSDDEKDQFEIVAVIRADAKI
ncbi:MAG TPA: hypothetical protein VGM57_14630 [Pseudolabrys sp.]|jgi:hypothetical protein